jgi:hypothetical protein
MAKKDKSVKYVLWSNDRKYKIITHVQLFEYDFSVSRYSLLTTQKIINTETGRVITKSLRTSEGTAGISFN